LYLDRYEAIQALDAYKDDSLAQQVFVKALSDNSYAIRNLGIAKVKVLKPELQKAQYEKVKSLVLKDENSSVRSRALKVISETYATENNDEVYNAASKDVSYSVESSLLKIYALSNKTKAWEITKKEIETENGTMQLAIAEFFAKEGTAADHDFFINVFTRNAGFSLFLIIPHYKNYIKRMDDTTIKNGIESIKSIASKSKSPFVANSVKGVLKEMKTAAKSTELQEEIQGAIDSIK
jgi:hypothetical protein